MTSETLEELLDSNEEQVKFLSTCAEFIPYISADCAGLSPGYEFLTLSVRGLASLKMKLPAHADTIQKTLEFYTTLAEKLPGPRGSVYPRGSEMFDDLGALDDLHGKLLEALEVL